MAHAQKPDFVFRRNGRLRLNRRGASVQSTAGSRGVRISYSNAGYTMFRGRVKGTGYPFHSAVSPSLSLPCVTTRHHISTGVYLPSPRHRHISCGTNSRYGCCANRRVGLLPGNTKWNVPSSTRIHSNSTT